MESWFIVMILEPATCSETRTIWYCCTSGRRHLEKKMYLSHEVSTSNNLPMSPFFRRTNSPQCIFMEIKLKNPPVSQLFAYEGLCSRHTKLLREGRPTRKNAVFMSYIDVIIYSVSVIKFLAFNILIETNLTYAYSLHACTYRQLLFHIGRPVKYLRETKYNKPLS